jgi:spore maturation protein CgeB
MRSRMQMILEDAGAARALAEHGRQTILGRHTCAHRVDELMNICSEVNLEADLVGSRGLIARPTTGGIR